MQKELARNPEGPVLSLICRRSEKQGPTVAQRDSAADFTHRLEAFPWKAFFRRKPKIFEWGNLSRKSKGPALLELLCKQVPG